MIWLHNCICSYLALSQCGSEEPQSIAHMISEVSWHSKKELEISYYTYVPMHACDCIHYAYGFETFGFCYSYISACIHDSASTSLQAGT